MKKHLQTLINGDSLSSEDIRDIVDLIITRTLDTGPRDTELAAWIALWSAKGETPEEISNLVGHILGGIPTRGSDPASKPLVQEMAIDLVGTGGDGSNSVNISTAAAVIVAACGVPVAKHGNRSISSKSGSADVLEAWGISFPKTQAEALHSLETCNICFLYAPLYNSVMRHLAPIRRELGIRSCFNIIGPLLNPFGVKTLLVGVYTPTLLRPMAEILKKRGVRRAMVVHSMGMDEATTLGTTLYCEVGRDGSIQEGELQPDKCGLDIGKEEELRGGTAELNAKILSDIFQGGHAKNRTLTETLILNAGIALYLADRSETIYGGCDIARTALLSGAVYQTLEDWRNYTQG